MTANTEDSRRRRRLQSCITQLQPPPRFDKISTSSIFHDSSFAIRVNGCDMSALKSEFDKLNSDQKAAILKVVSAEDFAVIQGLPGTGKSATISFLTRLLVSQGKRVLLTSYTHSAVDNLFCKLLDSGLSDALVRIGKESSCHPRVHATLAQNLACVAESAATNIGSIELPNVNFLHNVVSSAKVIGVTALTAPKSPLLSGQHFDYVIVDEAGQINQPAILGAITAADKFVLVGDHMQLPPLARSRVAEQAGKRTMIYLCIIDSLSLGGRSNSTLGFGRSLLSHLAEGFPESVAKLTMQVRLSQ
jgi:superfamily I DNA and/or RNA helicase